MDTTQVPSKVFLAPKASDCFWEGTQEIFGAVSEDLLGGNGKAEDAKLPGAGIIPKPCPKERAEKERIRTRKSRGLARVDRWYVIDITSIGNGRS